MKRKEYRDRLPVTVSVEKDRWKDFEDLCDKERKSISLKISELLEAELQKNALGLVDPNRVSCISYNTSQGNKPSQSVQLDMDQWLGYVSNVSKQDELSKLKSVFAKVCNSIDSRSMQLRMERFRKH